MLRQCSNGCSKFSSATQRRGVHLLLFATLLFTKVGFGASVAMHGMWPNEVRSGEAQLLGHYAAQPTLRLVLGLEHPRLDAEARYIEDLQDKASPNFHKFLTPQQWNARFAPSAADEQAVVDWARTAGMAVTQRFDNRLLVDIEAPVEVLEHAFGVSINAYRLGPRAVFSNDREPTVPSALLGRVHSIGGMNSIRQMTPATLTRKEPLLHDYSAGMPHLRGERFVSDAPNAVARPAANEFAGDATGLGSSQAYDLGGLQKLGHCCSISPQKAAPADASVAIASVGLQSTGDLQTYQQAFPNLAFNVQFYSIDGAPTCCDEEGTMDIELASAWANSGTSALTSAQIFVYDGANALLSTFTDIYNHVLTDGYARVFSVSWGCAEVICTASSEMDTEHGIFAAMAAQGWTLVASSGDNGATESCVPQVAVIYPGSDPYVVAAGGTALEVVRSGSEPSFVQESAWPANSSGCANNGGGTGGGLSSYFATPAYQTVLGYTSRAIPDLALNAASQDGTNMFYFDGGWYDGGGTSAVAPEVAGFFAQENAYLDYLGSVGVTCNRSSVACSPLGVANTALYYIGENPQYAPHYPFYDITSGCNDNDVTAAYALNFFCASVGHDLVSGWGSFNALQLAWAINNYLATDSKPPSATLLAAPAINSWQNHSTPLIWSVSDGSANAVPATGVAGLSYAWDAALIDSKREATPGSADGFYAGPDIVTPASGAQASTDLALAGDGCHTLNIRSWDNTGVTQQQSFGPYCYDATHPVTTAAVAGTLANGEYLGAATVTLSATDAASGVKSTSYSVDGATPSAYATPFSITASGWHSIEFNSVDVAGNIETSNVLTLSIASTTTPVAIGLSGRYNVAGIGAVGSKATTGGLDGAGGRYAANLLGSSISWAGATFALGPVGGGDALASIMIALPAIQVTTLKLLGAGVNGNQPNQSFVVTYADGSKATFVQGMSNWNTPQHYAGESVATTTSYKLLGDGTTHPGAYNVYGYSFNLDPAKTVANLQLPNNKNVVILAIDTLASTTLNVASPTLSPSPQSYDSPRFVTLADSTPGAAIYYTLDGTAPNKTSALYSAPVKLSATTTVEAYSVVSGKADSAVTNVMYQIQAASGTSNAVDLSKFYNVVGLGRAGQALQGAGIDGAGNTYGAELVGSTLVWSGATFSIAPSGANNAVSKSAIALPALKASKLLVLATAVNGEQAGQQFQVVYSTGAADTFSRGMSNWNTPIHHDGEVVVLNTPYKVLAAGAPHAGTYNVYGYTFTLNSGLTLKSLILPANRNVVILAVNLTP